MYRWQEIVWSSKWSVSLVPRPPSEKSIFPRGVWERDQGSVAYRTIERGWDWELTSELQLTASHSWAGTQSSSSTHRYQNTKMAGCTICSVPNRNTFSTGHIRHQEYCCIYFVVGELHFLSRVFNHLLLAMLEVGQTLAIMI